MYHNWISKTGENGGEHLEISNVLYENSNIVGFYAKNQATFLFKIFHSIIELHDPKSHESYLLYNIDWFIHKYKLSFSKLFY